METMMMTMPMRESGRREGRTGLGLRLLGVAAAGAVLAGGAAHAGSCDPENLFAAQVLYGTGAEPISVAIGDLDGDGFADLVAVNRDSDNISVVLNNGDGTFAPGVGVLYGVGFNPHSVAIGDLNGDGAADVAVSNASSSNISVLLNNGDGTFAEQVFYGTGFGAFSVAIGDLDGDGDGDLVVANQSLDNISVLLNNGDGTFASDVLYGAGDGPRSVAIGDLNGDGHLDLAVANENTDNVSVLLNAGDGTFTPDVLYGAGDRPRSVAIGDLDGDGHPDLAVANLLSGTSVLLNNGDGTFAPDVLYGVGLFNFSVAIGDLNGDGAPDLAVAKNSSDNFSVLLNNGDGTFAADVLYDAGDGPQSVAIGDLDGDGDADLVVANFFSDVVSVFLNQCITPPFISAQPVPALLLPVGGGVAELSVTTTGTAPLTYQWSRDGVPLTDGDNISGAESPTLTVAATTQDEGVYEVVVSNAGGSVVSAPAVIAVRSSGPGDINGDGVVDTTDLGILLGAFGAVYP